MSREGISPRSVVELSLRPTGNAPAAEVYAAANAAGIADQPLRLALRRLQAAGEIEQEGRGRRAVLRLTAAGRERLRADDLALALAAGQDDGSLRWDGCWHLVAVSTPESGRSRRDRLRRELVAAGAAAVSTGLHLSPHDLRPLLRDAEPGDLVHAVAADLDVHGLTDPTEIVERLWPADPVLAGYVPLRRAVVSDDPSASPELRRLLLADALERALRHDPLIPPELRARDWEPSHVRRDWWERWEDAGGEIGR